MEREIRVSRQRFIAALDCLTAGWFAARTERASTLADQHRRYLGDAIAAMAHDLYPNGVQVSGQSFLEAVSNTRALILDGGVSTIFGGAFVFGSHSATAAILVRAGFGQSFKLIEVKQSLSKDTIEPEHITELAHSVVVLEGSGVSLVSVGLLRIDKNWRLGNSSSAFFVPTDCAELVLSKSAELKNHLNSIATAILDPNKPEPTLQHVCGQCDYFKDVCLGSNIEYPIYELPRLHKVKCEQLLSRNIFEIADVPDDFELSANQSRVRSVVKGRTPWLDRAALERKLDSVQWPAYYLDFETTTSPIPFWTGVAPYESIVTQYSIHVSNRLGETSARRSYLAEHTHDCRRELTARLLEDLGDSGSIIVYSSYEKTMLKRLAELVPESAHALRGCIDRLFDLEKVFQESYYHPAFRGRTSIKATLPALVPSMSYKGMAIADGETASAAFARMVVGLCSEEELGITRQNLLDYCCKDTEAMLHLHAALANCLPTS